MDELEYEIEAVVEAEAQASGDMPEDASPAVPASFEPLEEETPFDTEAFKGHKPKWRGIRWPRCAKRPYGWTCWIRVFHGRDSKGNWINSIASGVLLGPKHVVTAAHNLYRKGKGRDGWPTRIEVVPGRDGERVPAGMFLGKKIRIFQKPDAKGSFTPVNDIAIFNLNRSTGLGNIGIWPMSDTEIRKHRIQLAGFPQNVPSRTKDGRPLAPAPGGGLGAPSGVMVGDSGKITKLETDWFEHDADIWVGHSGCGIWVETQNNVYLVGVQSEHSFQGRTPRPDGKGHNQACRITGNKRGMFDAFMKANP